MTLSGAKLLSRARRYADDEVAPYSVDDELAYEFLSEAERELALVGKLLRYTTTYSVATNDRWVFLDDSPEVIEFKLAFLIDAAGKRYPLKLQGTMDSYPPRTTNDYGLQISTSDQLKTGRPTHLLFGKATAQLELSPPANAPYTIEATQLVYPESPITASSEPEIAERHHPAIAIGAAVRMVEVSDMYDVMSMKAKNLTNAWQRALVRAAQESGVIMRDAGTVQFANEYW
jgi:hypothetical protein